ncbi:hypothetical protein ATE92_2427 [Ulvibacter sp. MAR_2010_11]|uniref:hypothetical protein n=1 Tax=Ulvibacter sp. MAR_2010_11 TaxID=1250229 RepID=UPI000C2C6FB8|nr:hypothetical protein [Ulvibacter sp. MAR_2010_11]PKA84247.1 hypothetical protein ATE92_2427 [Ulvibacter sp. MAR_2010_11]
MKKVIVIVLFFIILFVILIYSAVLSTNEKASTDILINVENIETVNFKNVDSVHIAATTLYDANELKKLVQGEHYRNVWATPVKVPVVFLEDLEGGLEVVEKGGGKQTKSLKLKRKDGTMYTLRSIAKNPDPLIPGYARSLGLENVIIDGVSAQHPYGAIVVAHLAETLGILHTNPKMVFVPKQELLEEFNKEYGNKLYWLEYETEGKTNWSDYDNVVEILETDDLQELKAEVGDKLFIDENALVRARLLDIIVGDWDRHSKQWGWVIQKQGDQLKAIVLPGDRDNAFFDIDGLIPSLISSKQIEVHLRPFESDIDYLPGLIHAFDRYFLLKTSASIFIEEAKFIQKNLTDEKILQAISLWPKEIRDLDNNEIAAKIKSRRDDLHIYALEFKKVIDEQGPLKEPLEGSVDIKLPANLLKCFECNL